jgi:hypothetical protein
MPIGLYLSRKPSSNLPVAGCVLPNSYIGVCRYEFIVIRALGGWLYWYISGGTETLVLGP